MERAEVQAELERLACPDERAEEHARTIACDRLDRRGGDTAPVEHAQRLLDGARPEQAEPRVDGEDVERLVGHRAGRDRV